MTPEELQQLIAIRQAQNSQTVPMGDGTTSIGPPPPVPPAAPPPNPADPYNKQAADYAQKAAGLEAAGSAMEPPQPHGLKENLVDAARAAMENFGRLGAPGGSYGQDEQRKQDFLQQQAGRLAQAKNFRGLEEQQQALGEKATTDVGKIEELKQLRDQQNANAVETSRHNLAEENKPVMQPQGSEMRSPTGGLLAPATPKPITGGYTPVTVTLKADPKKLPQDALEDNRENSPTAGHLFIRHEGGTLIDVSGQTDHYDKPSGVGDTNVIMPVQGPNGPELYRVPKKGAEGPIQNVGGQGPLAPKAAEAPVQMKNQADAAKSTKDMIGIVRQVMKDHPDLTGPAIGRAGETMVKFGGDPAGILAYAEGQPNGFEKNTALLAGHLAYLFLNEARATMPGRPSKDFMEFVKSRSAAITQNPNVMEGFLQAAENNSDIQLRNAAAAGYDPFKINAPAAGTAPAKGWSAVKVGP